MKEPAMITVNRADLVRAVKFASLGVAKRAVVPILAGMRVSVTDGRMELSAFDYELSARITLPGDTIGDSSILVDAKDLAKVTGALPGTAKTMVDVVIENGVITLTAAGVDSALAVLGNADEYPALPVLPAETAVVDASDFARQVGRVVPCASTDDTLPVLTCVKLTGTDGTMTLAATDRYRLAVAEMPYTGTDFNVNIPAKVVAQFVKAADKAGKISVHAGDTHTALTDGTRTLTVHPNAGQFPNHRHLVRGHDDHATILHVDATALHAAADRARKLTGKNERMGFDVTDGRITVTAVSDGQQVSSQNVTATVTGPDWSTGFNAQRLAPVLAGLTGTVRIGLKVNTTTTTDYSGKEVTRTSEAPAQITADDITVLIMTIRKPE